MKSLPKPVGVFVAADSWAQHEIDACEAAAIDTPREVAVIGVDNKMSFCECFPVTLTSIAPDHVRMGMTAAKVLDNMMCAKRINPVTYVPPVGVVQRASTDVFSTKDKISPQGPDYCGNTAACARSATDKRRICHHPT